MTRLFTKRVGGMFIRNTVVSTGVFMVGLAVLWVLVQFAGVDEVVAAAIGFIISNSLHYIFGRVWIFRGTERKVGTGYALFLVNAGVGLVITVTLFAAFLEFTSIHYLVARVIVSVFAGLAMFFLNAVFNFRQV